MRDFFQGGGVGQGEALMDEARYFKVLRKDGTACPGENEKKWNLPIQNADGSWTPGEWMPELPYALSRWYGYQLCQEKDLAYWSSSYWSGHAIYGAEYRGEMIELDDKLMVRQARLLHPYTNWNDRTASLFGIWCAREVAKSVGNPNPLLMAAYDVAEQFIEGQATKEEVEAAYALAGAGTKRTDAQNATWDAAWASAKDARTKRLMEILDGPVDPVGVA